MPCASGSLSPPEIAALTSHRQKVAIGRKSAAEHPVDWGVIAERYAADPKLTLEQISRDTGRTLATVRTHYAKRRWRYRRVAVQAKTREAVAAKPQQSTERFAMFRHRMMLKIAKRGLRALCANLEAPAGEEGFGSDKVDAYQLQAILRTMDDGTLAGKVADQLTPFLLESLDREATTALVRERIDSFRTPPPHANGTSQTHSTPKPACANGRVASLFSRHNGSS